MKLKPVDAFPDYPYYYDINGSKNTINVYPNRSYAQQRH